MPFWTCLFCLVVNKLALYEKLVPFELHLHMLRWKPLRWLATSLALGMGHWAADCSTAVLAKQFLKSAKVSYLLALGMCDCLCGDRGDTCLSGLVCTALTRGGVSGHPTITILVSTFAYISSWCARPGPKQQSAR